MGQDGGGGCGPVTYIRFFFKFWRHYLTLALKKSRSDCKTSRLARRNKCSSILCGDELLKSLSEPFVQEAFKKLGLGLPPTAFDDFAATMDSSEAPL